MFAIRFIIFFAILGNLFVASYHLITHAFFKCLLFLSSGVIIHANNDEQDLRKMSSINQLLPVVYMCFSIGTLSLLGFIFMSGFYSKEWLLENLFSNGLFGLFIFIFATFGVFFSAFYSGRVLYLTFIKPHISFNKKAFFIEGDGIMYIALLILTSFSIYAGYLFYFSLSNFFWNDCLQLTPNISLLEYEVYSSYFLQHFPSILSLLGFFVGIVLFATSRYSRLSNILNIYHITCTIILKSYFDLFYSSLLSKNTLKIGFLQYFTLDRGFFELSYHIFYTLLNNGLKNKRLAIIWLFLFISIIPIYLTITYTDFTINIFKDNLFEDSLFLINAYFDYFDPTLVYPFFLLFFLASLLHI